MKQIYFFTLLTTLILFFCFSCQQNDFSVLTSNEIIPTKQFTQPQPSNEEDNEREANILEYARCISNEHNIILTYLSDKIYEKKETILTMNSPTELENFINTTIDDYIENNQNKYNIYEDLENCYYPTPYYNITGNEIEQMFTGSTLATITTVMTNFLDAELHEEIMKEVAQSSHIYSLQEQYALCALIAILDNSIQYWNNYDYTKIDFIPNHLQISNNYTEEIDQYIDYGNIAINNGLRILDVEVVIADAYWGWFGTVSSCGNLVVGGGAAAAASIFKILEINNL